ncbi:MAG: energy-coupled thiamine transporter ThiT [Oscillospiraceae bacterium]|jgi:thiamine transporter|nr:energy-coupled thiamine transporter ThiT [Oscillospiraceae bacterium]
MFEPTKMTKTAILAECAILAAASFVLSLIPGPSMPMGGTISWFSTVPVLLAAIRHGSAWGVGTAFVYGFTQMLLGMSNVTYALAVSPAAAVGCALLDYLLAYAVIGFAGLLYKTAKSKIAGVILAVPVTGALRLLCSFLSGVLIYGAYAWDGWPVWLYSLAYNAAWCVPDAALALIGVLALGNIKALALLPSKSNG